jgi:hypothetical protein
MIAPRSNFGCHRRAISPRMAKSNPEWVRLPKIGCIRAAGKSERKRTFAIVSRPIAIDNKTIRRVVIFDNHPESLRLILQSGIGATEDNVGRAGLVWIIPGFILIATGVAALLWPFLS